MIREVLYDDTGAVAFWARVPDFPKNPDFPEWLNESFRLVNITRILLTQAELLNRIPVLGSA